MPTNWSTDQLKEFFEMKAVEQDRRLENLEKSVGAIDKAIGTMITKVNTMWGAVGVIGIAIIGTAVKVFMGGN